ncbi:hypothetical protein BDR07DRAFT_1498802 [Suillus spraguei]|nr:hypothetical protein BDR07DRAFT_1498802 [Suillus spraguei]
MDPAQDLLLLVENPPHLVQSSLYSPYLSLWSFTPILPWTSFSSLSVVYSILDLLQILSPLFPVLWKWFRHVFPCFSQKSIGALVSNLVAMHPDSGASSSMTAEDEDGGIFKKPFPLPRTLLDCANTPPLNSHIRPEVQSSCERELTDSAHHLPPFPCSLTPRQDTADRWLHPKNPQLQPDGESILCGPAASSAEQDVHISGSRQQQQPQPSTPDPFQVPQVPSDSHSHSHTQQPQPSTPDPFPVA